VRQALAKVLLSYNEGGSVFQNARVVEDVPPHGRGAGTKRSLRSLPTLTILWFYDFM